MYSLPIFYYNETNSTDFLNWKKEEEKKTTTSYVRHTGWQEMKNGAKSVQYHCNRSGYFNSKSKGIHRLKSQGSNKIGARCPSSMIVKVTPDSAVHVTYYKTHCGHAISNAHIRLQDDDRTRIAGRHRSFTGCML